MTRVLFLCSRNRLRSPTAERVFADYPGIECTSAGLNHDAETPLTADLVAWAELIFVMEKAHLAKLRTRFKRHLRHQRVICLDVPDRYEFMEPALVELLKRKVERFLSLRHHV